MVLARPTTTSEWQDSCHAGSSVAVISIGVKLEGERSGERPKAQRSGCTRQTPALHLDTTFSVRIPALKMHCGNCSDGESECPRSPAFKTRFLLDWFRVSSSAFKLFS